MIPVNSMPAECLTRYAGSPVTLGVRPEDLYEIPPTELAGRLVRLSARILAVEPLGAETLLVLATKPGDQELIARIGRETDLRTGGEVMIALDTAAIHLFDRETGTAISERA